MNKPDFFILSFERSGTTTLWEYLVRHSGIARTDKEIFFFNEFWDNGKKWYSKHFHKKNLNLLQCDATTRYLGDKLALERMDGFIPKTTKFVIILRNPIHRAMSHWRLRMSRDFENRLGLTPRIKDISDVYKDLTYEDFYKRYCNANNVLLSKYPFVVMPHHFNIISNGRYEEHLKRLWKIYPRKYSYVFKAEDLFTKPVETYKKVIKFLGLKEEIPSCVKQGSNFGPKYFKYDITEEEIQLLSDYYKPLNEKLYKLLGVRYNWK